MQASSFHIALPPRMTAPDARAVMAALGSAPDGTPAALFVGGCVRNTVLEVPVGDIDIATIWNPEEAAARLSAAGIKVVPTGIEHGTLTAVVGKTGFEITTLRRDVETDGRRAVVAFTKDWAEDAQRRDFTMNTLLADGEGNVYDPTGRGLDDLRAGRVVLVGDAGQRIAEDYLRALRFFRFHALYGRGAPDPEGLMACRAAAGKIPSLSRERITQEFLKIVAVDDPVSILTLMFQNSVLGDLPDGGYDPAALSALARLQGDYDAADVMARLFVICPVINAVEKYLVLSGREKKRLEQLADIHWDDLSEKAIKYLIYREGNDISLQAVLLFLARRGEDDAEIINLARSWAAPVLPVDGDDAKKAGITPGPFMGEALRAVEAWWMENDFRPDRAQCLEELRKLT